MDIPFFVYILTDEITLSDYESNHSIPVIQSIEVLQHRSLRVSREFNQYIPDYVHENRMMYEIEKQVGNVQAKTLSDYLLNGLCFLAKKYLYCVNGHLYVRKELHEEWMFIVRLCSPLLICSSFYLDEYNQAKSKKAFFFNKLVPQFAETAQRIPYMFDLENIVRMESKLRDSHIHLNGSTETDVLWWSQIGNVEKWIESFRRKYTKDVKVRQQYEQQMFSPYIFTKRLRNGKRIINKLLDNLLKDAPVFNNSCDLFHPCMPFPVLAKGAYFYLLVLHHLSVNKDEYTANEFLHLILIQNTLHKMVTHQVQQKGFSQFQMIPNNDIRWLHESQEYEKRFDQLIHDGNLYFLEYLEGRFSPKEDKRENVILIRKIIEDFDKIRKKVNRNLYSDNQKEKLLSSKCITTNTTEKEFMPRLGLIAHFIKEKDNSRPVDERHHWLRKKIQKQSLALIATQRYLKYSSDIQIVGIDAAANEMDAGPEVFAPMFRWLKRKWEDGNKDLKQTFHAGEDFVHLLSGLRMMVEAASFLDMKQGDRIGHGTAAGIDPKLWIDRVGDSVCIKKGEWLDDLLVVYNLIADTSCPYEHLRCKLPVIATEIQILSADIYGQSYGINELYESWELRKYDPQIYLKKSTSYFLDDEDCMCQIKVLLAKKKRVKELFEQYHYDMDTKEKYDSFHRIELRKGLFSAEELFQIQNLVLHNLAQRGIAIEVPITSNLSISFYHELSEHHIGRWLKGGSEKNLLIPPIVMGTDDPGIFMTNIYIEYARLMTYLKEKGYNATQQIEEVIKLNRMCNCYSF